MSAEVGAAARRVVATVAVAELLVLSLWFSATAVLPALTQAWALTEAQQPWVTAALQLGFAIGALGFALTGLADRVGARRLFTAAALAGALTNAALLLVTAETAWLAFALRFVTGACLAGVYPTGMKILAGWFRGRRGWALGILVGSLTVGSALPHLVRGLGLAWRPVILTSSVLAVVGGLVVHHLVQDGPFDTTGRAARLTDFVALVRSPRYRRVVGGYLGHMWELYAAWTWAAIMFADVPAVGGTAVPIAMVAFVFIGIGGVSCGLGGSAANRIGSARVASGSMWVSGGCAVALTVLWDAPAWAVVPVLVLWGLSIVSDSAQFSALVTAVVEPDEVGSALALQTGVGFALSLVSIGGAAWLAAQVGWRWVPLALAAGPALGVAAMAAFGRGERAAATA